MGDTQIAKAIASGRIPKYITEAHLNENRDHASMGAIAIVFTLTLVIVVIRLVSRIKIVRHFGYDDALAVVSLLFLAAFIGVGFQLILLGRGRHFTYVQYVMTESNLHRVQHLDLAAHIIYATALVICRISGLAFYYRVCGKHRGFRTAIAVVLGILVAGYLPQIFLLIFHCRPVTALWPFKWEAGAEERTCLQWGLVNSVISGISVCSDLFLFGIPVAMLWMLKMSRKRKVQLAGILLPGFFVINISAARLVLVIKGQWDLDESWTYDPMLAVETAEIGATLIALSVPGLKPIVDRLLGRDSGIQSSSSPYRRTGSSPSIDMALSVMRAQRKSRGQHHSVLASQSAGSSDPGSMAGTTSETADKQTREGIFVQVDVNVKENYPNDRDEGAKTETAISRGI